jgi:hypothetical protein
MPSRTGIQHDQISRMPLPCWRRDPSRIASLAPDGFPRLVRVAAARAALLLGFWLMISGWARADLPVGLAAVAAAAWASLRLLPAGGIAVAACVPRGARAELYASVRGLRNGRCAACAPSEAATAAGLRGLSFTPAARRSAERVLRAVQSAAGNAANRNG